MRYGFASEKSLDKSKGSRVFEHKLDDLLGAPCLHKNSGWETAKSVAGIAASLRMPHARSLPPAGRSVGIGCCPCSSRILQRGEASSDGHFGGRFCAASVPVVRQQIRGGLSLSSFLILSTTSSCQSALVDSGTVPCLELSLRPGWYLDSTKKKSGGTPPGKY